MSKRKPPSLRSLFTEGNFARLLNEDDAASGDTESHVEGASGTSLDQQVDRLLGQYENDAKKSDESTTEQMEGIDWRDLVKGVLIEAGDDEGDDPDDTPTAGPQDGTDTSKLGMDKIDVAKFADSIVRLVDNYDSLLEVKNTLMRRAREFLAKSYSDEVTEAFDGVMRDDHGMEPGKDKDSVDDERFPAPSADRASSSAEPGPGGGGGAA